MIKPDKNLIGQVMLYAQGFKGAEQLSGKDVNLFDLCGDQLSDQSHFDFGLRSL
jgi:dynein heavy chain 1